MIKWALYADEIGKSVQSCLTAVGLGHPLTVHKAQGSQWEDVYLFDESFAFREHARRWLYTGITRAANRITIVR